MGMLGSTACRNCPTVLCSLPLPVNPTAGPALLHTRRPCSCLHSVPSALAPVCLPAYPPGPPFSGVQVFRVRHRESGQVFAVKRSRRRFRSKLQRERCLREIRAVAALPTHPNIVVGPAHGWEEQGRRAGGHDG